jgi:uncharacterized integral membrane protein (TIGR00698 family)
MTFLPDVAFALIFGLAIRNLVIRERSVGAAFTVHFVLRFAIILLGSSLGLADALNRGGQTLVLIVVLVVLAMGLGFALARVFNLGNAVGTLIGVGTAICGASAILVVSPLVRAKTEETAYALTTIFAFNLVALFAYPWVGHELGMSQTAFGTWTGTAVNDTSVVIATGYIFGATAGVVATVVKLTRTALLVPVAVFVGLTQPGPKGKDLAGRVTHAIPWFVFGFLALSVARSLGAIPATWLGPMAQIALFLIVCVLGAVGLNTDLRSFVRLGPRPLIVGFLLAGTMGVVSIAAIEGLHLG